MSHHLPRAWRLTLTAGLAAFIAVPAAWTSPAWASAATSHAAPGAQARVPLRKVVRNLQWVLQWYLQADVAAVWAQPGRARSRSLGLITYPPVSMAPSKAPPFASALSARKQ